MREKWIEEYAQQKGTLRILRESHPDQIALTTDELALLMRTTARSIRIAVAEERWPIQHRRVGRRILFPISAVAAYLDGDEAGEENTFVPQPARKRGRPRKTAPTRRPEN